MSNTALDKIREIIDNNQNPEKEFKNFVLQGGAGSGKTESLKEVISYIAEKHPEKKIVCITHTNVAVDEIIARVGNKYEISTIHSFLNSLIKDYKKNLKEIIHNVFCIPSITELTHSEYKKVYEKYSAKLFLLKEENCDKVIGKKEYDVSPSTYNVQLNEKIAILNDNIKEIISSKDHNLIAYNETRFDSFEELTFSHDSLLLLSYKLCERFKLLPKIISDKYDFILIDEYQDTNENIINLFLNLLPKNKKTTVGLFGDSMQGIYDDGIGDVEKYIEEKIITRIDKEDNYRCSEEVIRFINNIRTDGIEQKLALKKDENLHARKGFAKLYYKKVGKKPNTFSPVEDKQLYLEILNSTIEAIKKHIVPKCKILMLTNKSISSEIGFANLYNIFSERYSEVKEEIEKELDRIQISTIVELCRLYQGKQYNSILTYLKRNGFQIKTLKDKKMIISHFDYLLSTELNLQQVLDYSFENKILKKTERFNNYILRRSDFLENYNKNQTYKDLESLYFSESNTKARLKKDHNIEISDEEFSTFERSLKKKIFYIDLFSDKIMFDEVLNYYKYLNEETGYITMHKTKGSGIENVIVVLDEFFWNKYNFKSIYDESVDLEKRSKNQKLFYVACSRTIKHLTIIRLIEDDAEEAMLKTYFKNIEIELLPTASS
jgi:DNA helicase-2/ATP-dependent DNA helicase PcrA